MAATSFRSDSRPAACGRQPLLERAARFLADHPRVYRALAGFCRSGLADRLMAWAGRAIAARLWRQGTDYAGLLERYSSSCCGPLEPETGDIDREFLEGVLNTPRGREAVARFLRRAEGLHPQVKAGLVKTLLHAAFPGGALRRARFLRGRAGPGLGCFPMDAIVASFGRCNLRCRGCYTAAELGGPGAPEDRLRYVMDELGRLNVAHVLWVGKGEPFYDAESRRVVLRTARRNPHRFFSLYTNGTGLGDGELRAMAHTANLIPVLSIDGPEEINDRRRGQGVYRSVTGAMRRMRRRGMLFGYISTVFRQNADAVLAPEFIDRMAGLGCCFAYYSLFISLDPREGREMMLDGRQRAGYFAKFRDVAAGAPIPLVDIDGAEGPFGCRARCGATIYIDAITGRVSPCVRMQTAPEECNLYRPARPGRLEEILDSPFFRGYREGLPATPGCEAFARADWEIASTFGALSP